MGEPDKAQRESAKITADKKTGYARLFLVVIALVVIVAGVLWLSGLLSPDKFRKTAQVVLEKKEPVVHKKKITQPVKAPAPVPAPEKESSSQSEGLTVKKEDRSPLPQKQPETLSGEPIHTQATSEKPSLPPHEDIKRPPNLPPITAEKYPYSLHMGSYRTMDQARTYMATLRKQGLSPYWTLVNLGEKGTWYRVFVGHFKSSDMADAFQAQHELEADRIIKTGYAVQIGLYTSKEELEQKVAALRKSGQGPYIIERSQGHYQLLVGALQTKRAADNLAARLSASGVDCQAILR
jgi:cell division protein FtsN